MPAPAPSAIADLELGPAMKALSPRQRQFVYHLIEQGGDGIEEAAAKAGFNTNNIRAQAHRLVHDFKVNQAMVEMARYRLHSISLLATLELYKIINDPTTKGNVKVAAIRTVYDRVGLGTHHTMNVKHEVSLTDKEQIAKIRDLATRIGVDAEQLLGSYGYTLEGEFTETKALPQPEEDWS